MDFLRMTFFGFLLVVPFFPSAQGDQQTQIEIVDDICRSDDSRLVRYLQRPDFVSLLGQADCGTETINDVARLTFSTWNLDYQGIVEALLSHPHSNRYTVRIALRILDNHADNISRYQAISNGILDHPETDGNFLARFAEHIVGKFDSVPDAQTILDRILSHPGAWENTLYVLARHADKFPRYHTALRRILAHPSTNDIVVSHLVNNVVDNADRIPNYRTALERIFYHPQVGRSTLYNLARHVVNDTDRYFGSQIMLERILAHPEISGRVIGVIARDSKKHLDKTSYGRFLDRMVAHPELVDGGSYIQYACLSIPETILGHVDDVDRQITLMGSFLGHSRMNTNCLLSASQRILRLPVASGEATQTFLENILAHPETDWTVLREIAKWMNVESIPELQIPDLRSFVRQIIDHPRVGSAHSHNPLFFVTALGHTARYIVENSTRIPRHRSLLDRIFDHPQVSWPDLGMMAGAVVENAGAIPNFQTLLNRILAHRNAGDTTLEGMGRAIVRVGIPLEFRTIFHDLIDHRAHDAVSVHNIIYEFHQNTGDIPNRRQLLQRLRAKRDFLKRDL